MAKYKRKMISKGQKMRLLDEPEEIDSGMYLSLLADQPGEAEAAMVLNSLVDDPDELIRETYRYQRDAEDQN